MSLTGQEILSLPWIPISAPGLEATAGFAPANIGFADRPLGLLGYRIKKGWAVMELNHSLLHYQ